MQSESHITSKILLTLSSLNFINYIINSYSLRKGTEKDEKKKDGKSQLWKQRKIIYTNFPLISLNDWQKWAVFQGEKKAVKGNIIL